MKKILPIFLFIIICVSHLNLIDAVKDLSAAYKKQNIETSKNFPTGEEPGSGKEKGKETTEDQEKYYNRSNLITVSHFQLADRDEFFCFNTALNVHPFRDDDIQPPNAV